MDRLCVNEGDGETLRCKLEGELNRRINMALKRVGNENCMELLGFVSH